MPHSHRHHHAPRDISEDMINWLNDPFGSNDLDNGNSPRSEKGADGGRAMVIHTVYKTLAPTFEGPIAGYSTLNIDPQPQPTREPPIPQAAQPEPTKSPVPKPKVVSTGMPMVISQIPTTSRLDTVLALATEKPTFTDSLSPGDQTVTPTSSLVLTTGTPTAESATVKDGSDGTGAGTKAGIAFGVLGGVFIVGLIAFLLFNRRRREAGSRREADDEKYTNRNNPFDAMTIRSDPHAPRISLRPVTQFLPNWNLDKRTSRAAAAALNPAATSAFGSNGKNHGGWDRPGTSQSMHPANPFGNQAERVLEPTVEERQTFPSSDPFTANGPAIAAGGLARKTSMRKDGPKNVDLTVSKLGPIPPSPAGTEFSITSMAPGSAVPQSSGAAAIAAAGGPANSNVHRVQLDFKPSLDDEMELKAGDLVRLLHEYDDGWALVIRLDRSRQGVVPRTCLSTRPVKPRTPQGASRPGPPINPSSQYARGPNQQPQGPGQRPSTPQGRPMTPQGMAQGRPRMGPGGLGGPGPRPMSPSGRPQSPGPRYNGHAGTAGGRPQSPVGVNRPVEGIAGPGPLNPLASSPPRGPATGPVRKPVPGQAY